MLSIPGYQVLNKIYESANSLVYQGKREQDARKVILKVLKEDYPTPNELTRYKQEYEITRNLNIDGVIKAYELKPYQRTLVIILEDIGASSLKQLFINTTIQPGYILSIAGFLKLAIKITEILGEIHAANIIHKDINPSNIIFNPKTEIVKIIDFGISTQLTRENPSLKNPNVLEGTLAYISPEQTGRMNRSLDYRTDFYSLGVTFYELLTRQLPFQTDDPLALVHCHIAKQPVFPHQINPEIPKVLSSIVIKMMAKTAEDRYQSAWGIKADLEECLTQLETKGNIDEFPLATKDIADKFQIPQKLYGRETEVKTLLTAFERVASGIDEDLGKHRLENLANYQLNSPKSKIEMMLVAGYSGIGKSALVQEIYQPITAKRGYFISGKFDQFQRNIPYSAVVAAFKELVKQLLTESENNLNIWRDKILTALGLNGDLIIDVIPEVELMIGKQPSVPELGLTEAQNRFNLVFQRFIRAFCTKEHPLVIFLDDLQWADSATLKLIELMMTDTDSEYLFLIGAYRDNEVSPSHPLMMTLDRLEKEGAIINQIILAPLAIQSISQLIADTLHKEIASVKALAELVNKKTEGNPFFVNEFMKTLFNEKLIKFDFITYNWQCDIAEIESKNITDNVIELMIAKVKRLPKSTQDILCFAACMGADFDLNTLAVIREESPAEIFQKITPSVYSGLILPTSELDQNLLIQNYKFLHDRVQQAAYALIDESQKQAIHLQIGRLLWQNTTPEAFSEKIFEIVDHINLGIELVTAPQEREAIAKLNLLAGQKAKTATAYNSAVAYLNVGIKLLTVDSWQSQYNLTLSLYSEAVEVAYLNGNYEEMEQWAEVAIKQAKTLIEKVKIYEVKIQTSMAQAKQLEAVKIGLEALNLMGISLPESPTPLDIQQALLETNNLLNGKNIDDLMNLPLTTDPDQLAIMRILASMGSPTYQAAPALFPLIVLSLVNLSVKYGNSVISPYGYVSYGVILNGVLLEIESAYEFGKLALILVDKFKALELKSEINFIAGSCTVYGKVHAKETLPLFSEGYQSGLENGHLEYGGYAAMQKCQYSYFIGQELTELAGEMAIISHSLAQLKQNNALSWNQIFQQAVINLLETSKISCCLQGEAYNEEKSLPLLTQANDRTGLHYFYVNKLILCYLFGDDQQALENAMEAEHYLDGVTAFLVVPVFHFYDSLVRLAIYPFVTDSEQDCLLKKVQANQEKMQKWADHAPMNFSHKFYLVEAERSRVLVQSMEAMDYYDRAIAMAQENEYINEEALAYELAAKFYLARNKEIIARAYMNEAHYAYTRWGAKAKVKDLEAKYPQLLSKLPNSSINRIFTNKAKITTTSTRDSQSGEALDLATVMKASQAISGEIVLDKLLAKLMRILSENAGAQIGFLILEKAGKWVIEAAGRVDSDHVTVLQSIPIEGNLPKSMINYVTRTKETVVKNDAANEGKFTNDPYIKANQTKSILCAPLINQGQLSGIVYLENNLTKGAFTPERLQVIQLLSGEAAIAITNAKLYAEVKESERRLTQYLEAMPIGVAVEVPNGQIHYANQTAQQLLGINILPKSKTDQLTERYPVYRAGIQELYPTAQLPTVRSLGGEIVKVDDIEIHQPNQIIPLEVSSTPIFDETGKIVYAIAAFQDITERKKAEKLIAEYNRTLEIQVAERTQALAQALEDLKSTQDELILSAKMAALGQLIAGIAHEVNTPLGAIRSSAGNIAKILEQTLEKLPTLFQSLSLEEGQTFLALLQGSLQKNEMLSTKEERKLKRALRSKLEELEIERADQMAEMLVIMGIVDEIDPFIPLLKKDDGFEILQIADHLSELNRGVTRINISTDRASKVVFALKSYARYDQSGEMIKFNLIEGIETVLTLYQNLLKQGVELIRNYAEIPPLLCYPDELNQVWTNLIHNALQAMKNKGTLTIDVREENQQAKISITDSGSGIPEEIKAKIFEPFFTTKPPGEGSGLGLDIVKKIIEKHSGSITVESQPGKTTFNVFIPIHSD